MAEKDDPRTPEQKQADKDRMAKVRAARKTPTTGTDAISSETTVTPQSDPAYDGERYVPREQFEQLMAEVQTLKAEPRDTTGDALKRLAEMLNGAQSGATVGKQGVQGIVDIASTNPNDYEDPTERLYDFCERDPRLERYNVRKNFRIDWSVEADSYKNDGVRYRFPRFRCELSKLLWNADGTPQMVTRNGKQLQRAAFRGRSLQKAEDEVDVITAAKKLGMDHLEELTKDDLLNEWRFWRLTEWLAEKILPYQLPKNQDETREEVIDGELVQIREFEVTPKTSVFGG